MPFKRTTSAECAICNKIATRSVPVLWEDEHWVVMHKRPPCGVVGHLQLVSKRHFQGPSEMTETEAASVGLTLRKCERVIERITKCDRVYTAALGSAKSGGHFHAHMVPLYVDSAGSAGAPPIAVTGTPFDVFLQEKLAADKVANAEADPDKCAAISAEFTAEMAIMS